MTVHRLFIALKPHDIRVTTLEGRLCLIVANYTNVYDAPPKVTDGQSQVFAIEVKDEDVVQQTDGDLVRLILWTGDPKARSRPGDLLTLPCESLQRIGASDNKSPSDLAKEAFADLPAHVQLAGVMMVAGDDVLSSMPEVGPERTRALRAWAESVLSKHAVSAG